MGDSAHGNYRLLGSWNRVFVSGAVNSEALVLSTLKSSSKPPKVIIDQLWELKSDNEPPRSTSTRGDWTLPILVTYDDAANEAAATVRLPQVPLLKSQVQAIRSRLGPSVVNDAENDEWLCVLDVLRTMAMPSEAADPEDVVMWNRQMEIGTNAARMEGVDEFIADWLLISGVKLSRETATTMFVSLMAHATHWLVNRRRRVNFIFATIIPLQYRRNWKEILLGTRAMQASEVDQLERWRQRGWWRNMPEPEEYVKSDLVDFDSQNSLCHWLLETEPSEWYAKASLQVEKNRRRRLGKSGYFSSVAKMLYHRIPLIRHVYANYIKDLGSPSTAIPEFGLRNGETTLEGTPRSAGVQRLGVKAVVVPAWVEPKEGIGEQGIEDEAYADLPPMPGLQPGNKPVRNPGQDVLE